MASEKTFYPKNRAEWRNWLEKNHAYENKIALINYKKHTGKPSLTHKESMEEAICFGWIDTTLKRLDDNRYIRRFSRRTDKSRWSTNTLSYAKKLIEENKMTSAGLKRYEEGLKKPVLNHGFPRNPETPSDLRKALSLNKKAKENFEKLSPSYRRMLIYGILGAKQEETKKRRMNAIVNGMLKNKKSKSL